MTAREVCDGVSNGWSWSLYEIFAKPALFRSASQKTGPNLVQTDEQHQLHVGREVLLINYAHSDESCGYLVAKQVLMYSIDSLQSNSF